MPIHQRPGCGRSIQSLDAMATFTRALIYVVAFVIGAVVDWLAVGAFIRSEFACEPSQSTCDAGAFVSIPIMLVTVPAAGLIALWIAARLIARLQNHAANDVV